MAFDRRLIAFPWDDYRCIPTLYDQDFGLGINLEDFLEANIGLHRREYHGPPRHGINGEVSGLKEDKDNFKVLVDVHQFSPDEVQVKTVDNHLVIEGKHEEKRDEHGHISRQFVRRYQLPEGVKTEYVTSTLSSDGVLTITAPKALPVEQENVRHVPIKHTGVPAICSTPGHHGSHVRHSMTGSHAEHHASHAHQDTRSRQNAHTQRVTRPHKVHHVKTESQEVPLAIKNVAANPHKVVVNAKK